jgi:hypothetical protein
VPSLLLVLLLRRWSRNYGVFLSSVWISFGLRC